MKIKLCDCYKKQLLELLKNNEIDFQELVPKCKHSKEILESVKNNLLQIISLSRR